MGEGGLDAKKVIFGEENVYYSVFFSLTIYIIYSILSTNGKRQWNNLSWGCK